MTGQLTGKQEAFARAVLKLGCASEAYRQIYASGPETTNATIWSEASRLCANPKVATRIRELRDEAAAGDIWALRRSVGKLEQARVLAMESDEVALAIKATMAQAKLLGLV